jgi:hypothetical protein
VKVEPVVIARQHDGAAALAIIVASLGAFAFFAAHQTIWDIGWLIEASRRWLAGAVLYRDIIEVNPPLIFYETVALSGGMVTQPAYVGGVCVVIALSSLWVLRLRGPYIALCAVASMIFAGMQDFGQRDHLALIFGLPLLLRKRVPTKESAFLGCWAFFGFGLKPYLMLIPLADGALRALLARSPRELAAPCYVALAALSCTYVAAVAVVHPLYLSEMVPLGRFVYWAYDVDLAVNLVVLSFVLLLVAAIVILDRNREIYPLAAAMIAALASFYIQGRYWTYHFVPALGLGMVLAMIQVRRDWKFTLLVALLIADQFVSGVPPRMNTPIPPGAKSVAILSSVVGAAYPAVLDQHAFNATRYPALWVLPGAWAIANDPKRSPTDRARALGILAHERTTILGDIGRYRPEYVMADTHLKHFTRPFDYMRFLGPIPGYRFVGDDGRYHIYRFASSPAVR